MRRGPPSRNVDPLVVESEGSIWIATNPLTRKVDEIQRDPRVTLMFFNAQANEYVTVLARASVVSDAARRAAHWKPEWRPFYKEQAAGADFMLFEVKPFRLEISSPRHQLNTIRRPGARLPSTCHEPLQMTAIPASRLQVVDALRGLALFGVFWANLLIFSGIGYMNDEQRVSAFGGRADAIAFFAERFFIENKFMGLFSLLFGISFWLFLNRLRDRVTSPVSLFYRRIFWLFVIGAIHGWLFWCFDILRFYALWAILLPLFTRTPPRRLLVAALTACVLIPAVVSSADVLWSRPDPDAGAYDAMALAAFSTGTFREFLVVNWRYDWYLTLDVGQIAYQVSVFGRLLFGLYVARTFDLARPGANGGLLQKVLVFGGAAGLIGSTIFSGQLIPGAQDHAALAFVRRLLVEAGQLGFTLAYAAVLVLSFNGGWSRAIAQLAPVGRMALTWYLLQTLFGIWMFYGFARGPALMGKVGPASLAMLAVAGFGAQVLLAHLWLHRFCFGPAEWCWRSLTHGKVQPLLLRRH